MVTVSRFRGTIFVFVAVLALTIYLKATHSRSHVRIGSIDKHIVVEIDDEDDLAKFEGVLDWEIKAYGDIDASTSLTVPINKGKEAMVYITYIIDHYDSLPDLMVFIPANVYLEELDIAATLEKLQTSHALSLGYTDLRCSWRKDFTAGFQSSAFLRQKPGLEVIDEVLTSGTPEAHPLETLGSNGGSFFALSRDTAHSISLREYRKLRHLIVETRLDNEVVGNIMEHSWHHIFRKLTPTSFDERRCECKLYGKCL